MKENVQALVQMAGHAVAQIIVGLCRPVDSAAQFRRKDLCDLSFGDTAQKILDNIDKKVLK